MYLNYDVNKDFVINLDNIWKWLGFSRKDPAKTLLQKNFKIDIDYKILKATSNEDKIFAPSTDGAKKKDGRGGTNKEIIMMTVNTFKKFCLKAGTKKADEIHDYYVNLENTLQETIIEESKQLKLEQEISKNTIQKLNKKLEKKYRTKYELTNSVYIISNKFFKGFHKIGKSSSFNSRLDSYSAGSPIGYDVNHIVKVRNKAEETIIENMILQIFSAHRVKNHLNHEREWIYGVDIEDIKKEIDNCINFLNERRDNYKIPPKFPEETENFQLDIDENEYKEINNNNIIVKDEDSTHEDIVEENNNLLVPLTDEIVEKIAKPKEIKNTKYNFNISDLGIKKNNPVDFNKFVEEWCEVGEEFYEIQTTMRTAHKIWCKTQVKGVEKQFSDYMKTTFKESKIFIGEQRRNVYKGIKLKPFTYKKTDKNFDFEQFIEEQCVADYLHRISYNDFFYYFTEWMTAKDPEFKINKFDKMKIQEILEEIFAKGRILESIQSDTKNLNGVFGIGIKENNYGLVEHKRHNKKVGEFDVNTNKLIKEYESIYLCAHTLKIPFTTFGNHLRNGTVIDGKIYCLLEDE